MTKPSVHAKCFTTDVVNGVHVVCARSKGHTDEHGHHDPDKGIWWGEDPTLARILSDLDESAREHAQEGCAMDETVPGLIEVLRRVAIRYPETRAFIADGLGLIEDGDE